MAYIEYRGREKTMIITIITVLSSIASFSHPEVFNCLFLAMSALKNRTKETILLLLEFKNLWFYFWFYCNC